MSKPTASRIAALLVSSCLAAQMHAADILDSAMAVAQSVVGGRTNCTFRLCGRIAYARNSTDDGHRIFAVEDASGAVIVYCRAEDDTVRRISPGDTACFVGAIQTNGHGKGMARCANCHLIAHGEPPPPIGATISELLDGKFDFRLTRITGTLRDATFSETFPGWIILVICGKRERIFVSAQGNDATLERFRQLIGSRVSATGVCTPFDTSARIKVGRTFKVARADDVSEIKSTAEDRVRIPDISEIQSTRESEISSFGYHKAVGRVIASWQRRKGLIRTIDGNLAELEFEKPPLPRHGETICAIGLPESDLYRINLVNASWKSIAPPTPDMQPPTPTSPKDIIKRQNGHELVRSSFHGKTISMDGIVRSVSFTDSKQLHFECDNQLIMADISALDDIPDGLVVGSRVRVSGTCILEHGERKSPSSFPQLKGFIIVPRESTDIVVLERPPWWTPGRLMIVIGGLLAIILGIVVRNKLQKRKAAMLAKFSTELKVEERTRLAVELHDSLAQNLTGVSLEINTAEKLADHDAAAMSEHLGRAARTLKSCRDELRNCLWDLRNRALEETSLGEAIRQTLAPHVVGVDVTIKFNVARERLSDNTTHAVLRIIRELAVNAIRHGRAKKLWVAGSTDGDNLLFSVRDNGCGFDPASAPGFAEGHYGLVGISERVETFEGEFNIESSPGKGTKATISLRTMTDK